LTIHSLSLTVPFYFALVGATIFYKTKEPTFSMS